jgi:hypothetical protein
MVVGWRFFSSQGLSGWLIYQFLVDLAANWDSIFYRRVSIITSRCGGTGTNTIMNGAPLIRGLDWIGLDWIGL